MQKENSNDLNNLIKNIKSQMPLIPIEGIENMSKGFFAAPKVWFQSWMKPAGISVVGAILVLTAFFIVNKNKTNEDEMAKKVSSPISTENTTTPLTDTLEVNQHLIIPLNAAEKNETDFADKNNKSEIEPINVPVKYNLTSADSAVLDSLFAEKQTFQIDALRDTMITGKMGTKVVFYKACFENMDGEIAKSNVTISLKECYNYPDMVKENLNTHWDSSYLESKGMIWLEASSGGKELKLREGFDCPIEFAAGKVDDFGLYYSKTDKYKTTNWEFDSLGKIPNPVIIPNSGRYWDISFNYFMDNFKLSKSSMIGLYNKNWDLHFTSTGTKMFGFTACTSANMYLNLACSKFRDLCTDIYKEVPNIKHSSWVTDFGFSCISRDSLNRWLANDTIQKKVNRALFGVNMKSPFFASQIGWINCDHPIAPGPFKRSNNQVITFENYPKDGYTKSYLLLKKRKAIANPGGSDESPVFYNMPRNAEATLFSYKLVNGKISYFQMDINTSADSITIGAYEPLKDADELVEKIDNLMDPVVN